MGLFSLIGVLLIRSPVFAFTLVSTAPKPGGEVSSEGPLLLVFSEPIASSSIVQKSWAPTFRLTPDRGAGEVRVGLKVAVSGNQVILVPEWPLAHLKTYSLYVSGPQDTHPLKGIDGSFLESGAYSLSFRVRDLSPPRLLRHLPEDGERLLPSNLIRCDFNEPVAPESLVLRANPPVSFGALLWNQAHTTVLIKVGSPPETGFQLSLNAWDFAGNPLSPPLPGDPSLSWFIAGQKSPSSPGVAPTILRVDPAPDQKEVSPDAPLRIYPSQEVSTTTLLVELIRMRDGALIEPLAIRWDSTSLSVVITHPTLEGGPTLYLLRILYAQDGVGRPLSPGVLPSLQWQFITRDETPPYLVSRLPEVPLDPDQPQDIILTFSEPLKVGQGSPRLRLGYESGFPPPMLTPSSATLVEPSLWIADQVNSPDGAGFDLTHSRLVLRFTPSPPGLLPNELLFLEVLEAEDEIGLRLVPYHYPLRLDFPTLDTRPVQVLKVEPSEDPNHLVSLSQPVRITFNKPLQRLVFSADGDWSLSADERLDSQNRPYNPRQWVAKSTAFNLDRTEVLLQHTPFSEGIEIPTPRKLTLLSAMDKVPKIHLLDYSITFYTGRRPRLEKWEYLAPVDWDKDLSPEGLLLAPFEPGRSQWRVLLPGAVNAVPLNSPLRAWFTEPMDPSTLPIPTSNPLVGSWRLEWSEDYRSVTAYPGSLLLPGPAQWGSNSSGELFLVRDVYTSLGFGSGRDQKGDDLVETRIGFTPIDVLPPWFQVEYLSNPLPGGYLPSNPQWKPLLTEDRGRNRVPADLRLRVTASETPGPRPEDLQVVALEGPPLPQIEVGGWQSDGTHPANRREFLFRKPLGPVMEGDPPREVSQMTYRFKVHLRDTRPEPQGNAAEATYRIEIEDRFPPRLVKMELWDNYSRPSNPSKALPTDIPRFTFSDRLDFFSLRILELEGNPAPIPGLKPLLDLDGRTVIVSHLPFPRPKEGFYVYRLQIASGLRDLVGNAQEDLPRLNDPSGEKPYFEIIVPAHVPGDLDDNGQITLSDVLLALKVFLGEISLSPSLLEVNDLYPQGFPDGRFGSQELNWVFRRFLGLERP